MHLYITLSLPSDALETSNVKGVMPQQNIPSQAWFTSRKCSGAHKPCSGRLSVQKMYVRGAQGMLGVHGISRGAWTMLRAPMSVFQCINLHFSVFLGVCFHITCFETWEHNFSLCNVFCSLLNLQS